MKMIYGTSNANKVKDIKLIIKAHGADMEILSLKDIGFLEEIEENGTTFEENSEIKAKAVKSFCDKNKIEYDIITTDDAGLCVDCLNGEPGVYSARYKIYKTDIKPRHGLRYELLKEEAGEYGEEYSKEEYEKDYSKCLEKSNNKKQR